MPFSNDVLIKQLTGQTILDALEFGVRSLPEPTSRFPQVSGITYKIDVSINSSVVVDEDENFIRVDGERRVYDVKINGEDLDINKNYTISSNSFILDGGDGYSMFYPFEITQTSIGVDNEVLMNYINNNLKGTIPSEYQNIGNRIIKTEGKVYDYTTTRYYRNKSSGLSGGIIAIIVIVPVLVLALTIATIFFLRKMNIKEIQETKNHTRTIDKFASSEKINE